MKNLQAEAIRQSLGRVYRASNIDLSQLPAIEKGIEEAVRKRVEHLQSEGISFHLDSPNYDSHNTPN